MSKDILVDIPIKDTGGEEKGPYVNINSVHGSDSETVVPDSKLHSYGRRRTMPAPGVPLGGVGYDGEKDSVNTFGKIYTKILNFNVVTRNLIYILPFSVVLAIPLIVFATVAQDSRAGGVRLLGLFIWLQVMWWCLWLSKLMAQLLPYVFQTLCGFVSSGTRKYRLVIRALELPLSFLFWTIICWATATPLITVVDQHPKKSFHWVVLLSRALLASIAVAALFLVEKLIIQLISINYHRRQFNARVNESKVKVHMLDALYDTSLSLFPVNSPAFRQEDFIIATGIDNTAQGGSNAKLVGTLAMFGENLQSTVGNIKGELTSARPQASRASAIHNVVIEALEMKTSTEALGKRIWFSLVAEGKECLEREDIYDILGSQRKEEADEVFNLLDADQNGDISLEEMVMWVQEVARERKAIARSMHDVGQAVKVLDRFLSVIAVMLLAIVYAAFFDAGFAKYVLNIGSQIAAVSFAISATVQEFLGSCIFVFVKHPYDVGDRILINDVHMVVEHISLLYTTFKRVDSNRMVQIPNIINNNNWCENISRSKAMKEQVNVSVHSGTSFADIEVLRSELEEFLTAPENKRDFFPDVDIRIEEVKDLKQIDLLVGVTHKSNWANEPLRLMRRNKLMTAVLSSLRTVPIYPAGADKPLNIRRPTKEEVDAAREAVIADREATKVLKDTQELAIEAEALAEMNAAVSTGYQASLAVSGQRVSIDSRRSGEMRRPAVGRRVVGNE